MKGPQWIESFTQQQQQQHTALPRHPSPPADRSHCHPSATLIQPAHEILVLTNHLAECQELDWLKNVSVD